MKFLRFHALEPRLMLNSHCCLSGETPMQDSPPGDIDYTNRTREDGGQIHRPSDTHNTPEFSLPRPRRVEQRSSPTAARDISGADKDYDPRRTSQPKHDSLSSSRAWWRATSRETAEQYGPMRGFDLATADLATRVARVKRSNTLNQRHQSNVKACLQTCAHAGVAYFLTRGCHTAGAVTVAGACSRFSE